MKSKLFNQLAILALESIAMTGGANKSDLQPEDIDIYPKRRIVPKGCKEYFFFENGKYCGYPHDQCVFSCIATSERKAIEKFNKQSLK